MAALTAQVENEEAEIRKYNALVRAHCRESFGNRGPTSEADKALAAKALYLFNNPPYREVVNLDVPDGRIAQDLFMSDLFLHHLGGYETRVRPPLTALMLAINMRKLQLGVPVEAESYQN